jgi:hypothetical protein
MFEEPTYCDGCKKFSSGPVCPHCETEEAPVLMSLPAFLGRGLRRDAHLMACGAAGSVFAIGMTAPHTVAEVALMLGAPMVGLGLLWVTVEILRYTAYCAETMDPREP